LQLLVSAVYETVLTTFHGLVDALTTRSDGLTSVRIVFSVDALNLFRLHPTLLLY
jgi:hypothetical protein